MEHFARTWGCGDAGASGVVLDNQLATQPVANQVWRAPIQLVPRVPRCRRQNSRFPRSSQHFLRIRSS
jgi:hypothetical protein